VRWQDVAFTGCSAGAGGGALVARAKVRHSGAAECQPAHGDGAQPGGRRGPDARPQPDGGHFGAHGRCLVVHGTKAPAVSAPASVVGGYIHTSTGRKVSIVAPRPDDLDIRDIAHGLSLLCRFTGQVKSFYSVAQHSLLVAANVPPEHARTALLHDASEAYLGDLSSPLKRSAGLAGYRELEAQLEAVIAERFGLAFPLPADVKRADQMALATEARDLFAHRPDWHKDWGPALPAEVVPLPSAEAELLFLARAWTLGLA